MRPVLNGRGFQEPIGRGAAGVARQFLGPKAETECAEAIFHHIEHDFNAGPDAIELDGRGRRERRIRGHQQDRAAGGDGEDEQQPVSERFPQLRDTQWP